MNNAHPLPVIKYTKAVLSCFDIQPAAPLFAAFGYEGLGGHGEKFTYPFNLPVTHNDAAFSIAAFTAHLAFKGFHGF